MHSVFEKLNQIEEKIYAGQRRQAYELLVSERAQWKDNTFHGELFNEIVGEKLERLMRPQCCNMIDIREFRRKPNPELDTRKVKEYLELLRREGETMRLLIELHALHELYSIIGDPFLLSALKEHSPFVLHFIRSRFEKASSRVCLGLSPNESLEEEDIVSLTMCHELSEREEIRFLQNYIEERWDFSLRGFLKQPTFSSLFYATRKISPRFLNNSKK